MAFVPIQESGLDYGFFGENGEEIVDSVIAVSANNLSAWSIFNIGAAINFRITIQSYEAVTSGDITEQAQFDWGTSGLQINQTVDGSGFTPSPVTGQITDQNVIDGDDFIAYTGAHGSEGNPEETYSFLIEVEIPGPAEVSYNCECDDDYPRRTLAQIRAMLATRLGYAAQVASGNYPPGMAVLLDSFAQEAQELAYRSYKVFRLERFFTWNMVEGVRFYDLLENADVCTKKLDPRMVTWVGISQDDNFWRPLICGIRPEFYYSDITSWPTHYEIRQCIEVWPAPSDQTWKLRIKGYFDLMPFVADGDYTTIDYRAVFLLALANAKAHYGQPDAANYASQYREFIGNLVAGSHHTRRYIPEDDQWIPPPLPILTGYPGDP